MTIRISLRAVAFIVYTLALLGGAFGISYAVFEWRDDSPDKTEVSEIEASLEQLDDDVGTLGSRISTLSSDINNASGHSHDDCGSRIAEYVFAAIRLFNRGDGLTETERSAADDFLNNLGSELLAGCR